MKIFDLNIHLTYSEKYRLSLGSQTEKAASSLVTESQMLCEDYDNCLSLYEKEFSESFSTGNFMFFNSALFSNDSLLPVLQKISNKNRESVFTALLDYRLDNYIPVLDNLVSLGFKGIKFHPYSQQILESDWDRILLISKEAAARKLNLFVCTSFGTSVMHKHNGMGLACRLAEHITEVPIILLHSGGVKIYEAMLLAEDKSNIYLDTSFSIHYLQGSPLLADYAYAYRKIGIHRVLYGSDFPYVGFSESIKSMESFFDQFGFKESEKEAIYFGNSQNLFFHPKF